MNISKFSLYEYETLAGACHHLQPYFNPQSSPHSYTIIESIRRELSRIVPTYSFIHTRIYSNPFVRVLFLFLLFQIVMFKKLLCCIFHSSNCIIVSSRYIYFLSSFSIYIYVVPLAPLYSLLGVVESVG